MKENCYWLINDVCMSKADVALYILVLGLIVSVIWQQTQIQRLDKRTLPKD